MARIAHLTSAHPAFDQRIFEKECLSLTVAGYEVHLVVPHPSNENVRGVFIEALPRPKSRLARMFLSIWRILIRALQLKADLYHFHDPELIPVGLLLKLCGNKVIYDMHENSPQQIMIREWLPKPLKPIVARTFEIFENLALRAFDGVCVPQPSMQVKFEKLNPQTILVANFVRANTYPEPIEKASSRKQLLYAGGISEPRGAWNMTNAMEFVHPGAKLLLAGPTENPETEAKLRKICEGGRVEFFGRLPPQELQSLYRQARIGLILYNNVGQYYLSFAVKLFEFMLYEIPLVLPNFGEWPKFNEENDCGICVDVTNAKEVANAINYLIDNPDEADRLGRNGRVAALAKYTWETEAAKLVALYRNLLHD